MYVAKCETSGRIISNGLLHNVYQPLVCNFSYLKLPIFELMRWQRQLGRHKSEYTLFFFFFFYTNVVFPAQAEYSYFPADFRLKIFLSYS